MNSPENFFTDPHRTLKEAAVLLGLSVTTLRREKRRGLLKVFPMGGNDCILESEIHAYRERKIQQSK
jgi:predicted site-specific integrase-resolvase